MTVQWTSVDVPLGAGLDTKTNEKLLKPPFAADLVDATFPASGVAGYETRKGYVKIGTSTTVTAIDTLIPVNNELLVLDGTDLYTVSELANNVDLINRGDLLSVEVKQTPLDNQNVNQTYGQIAEAGGLQVFSWTQGSHCYYTVKDSVTGAVISRNTQLTNGTKSQIVTFDTGIMIIWHDGSSTTMESEFIPFYDPSTPVSTQLATDANATAIFDCVENGQGNRAILAYFDDSGTNRCTVLLIDAAATIIDSDTIAGIGATVAVSVAANTGKNYAYTISGTNSYNQIVTPTFTDLSGAGAPSTTFLSFSPINIATVYLEDAAVQSSPAIFLEAAGDLVYAAGVLLIRQSNLASRAFLINNKAYAHIAHHSSLQNTLFLLDYPDGQIQASCLNGIAGAAVSGVLPKVTNKTWAPVYRENLDIDLDPDDAIPTDAFSQFGLKRVEYNDSFKPQAVEYGYSAYIASGILWQYDGINLVEQGFLVFPEDITPSAPAGTGSLDVGKDYSYRVYYEWTNAQGERQRSTTARIVTQLTTSSQRVQLVIPTLCHTHKGNDVSIVVYRTEGNPNIIGGAPFYRVSDPDPDTAGATNGYINNDITADTVTFVDEMADTDLRTKELDYLNTNELDNVAPVSASIIGEAKKRVWLAGFERPNQIQFSKLNTRRTDQLEFHDLQTLDVPEDDGPVTAFGELKHFVVVFKENSCYAISGEGPNNLGAGFFNLPQLVSHDVGCINQRTVVNIPQGIMFQSNKGIWLLGQNLDMRYIGANVEAYNDQTFTAATLIPDENQVIFLTESGSTLMYNYLVDGWSRYTNHEGNHATLFNGVYTYARTNGEIYRQSGYTDNGTHYAMKFVTAPIAIKGVQGKQRIRHVRLLGQYYSPHELRVGVRYDHEPGVIDEGTWNPADGVAVDNYGEGAYGSGAYGGAGSPVYQARFNLPRQKCQSVQFVIDTINTTGNAGRAVSIQAIQVEVGAKTGTHELSVDSSFSATGGSTT